MIPITRPKLGDLCIAKFHYFHLFYFSKTLVIYILQYRSAMIKDILECAMQSLHHLEGHVGYWAAVATVLEGTMMWHSQPFVSPHDVCVRPRRCREAESPPETPSHTSQSMTYWGLIEMGRKTTLQLGEDMSMPETTESAVKGKFSAKLASIAVTMEHLWITSAHACNYK